MAKLRTAKNKENLFGAGCLGIVILAGVVMWSGNDAGDFKSQDRSTVAEIYPGEWQEPTPEVMRALAKNGVRGCGEFYQRKSVKDREEYAVACARTPEGAAGWVVYLVWPATGAVTGPDYTAVWKMGGPPRPDPR